MTDARGPEDRRSADGHQATHVLRFSFDPGSGVCLWSMNRAANDRFGYPVDSESLPVSENLRRRLDWLAAWHATSIDWDYPPDPSPWSEDERARFAAESGRVLAELREALGPDYQVLDGRAPWESTPAQPPPG